MQSENGDTNSNKQCLTSFKKHWAEAQIDGPMQEIARYDDVAKLLVTIGGFLLTVLAAGYSIMLKDIHASINVPLTTIISGVILFSMLMFFVCAAGVCYPHPERMAGKILNSTGDKDLTDCMTAWCASIDKVISRKRLLLGLAIFFFILSFLVVSFLLLNLLSLTQS
jgi:hypothetical protein